jgi:hypothetical protein
MPLAKQAKTLSLTLCRCRCNKHQHSQTVQPPFPIGGGDRATTPYEQENNT